MGRVNRGLEVAKRNKKDEFYTQLIDIENELRHYRKHFKDKVVLCNCDDPFESNFFKFFVLNFNKLKLKQLIATSYDGSPIAGTQYSFDDLLSGTAGHASAREQKAYKAVVNAVRDTDGNGVTLEDVVELFRMGENELTELEGNGDFRSQECLEVLDRADIVVTNPPFSLFREYVATLMGHEKKFLIIGNVNAITYKEFFPYLQNNEIWVGYKFNGAPMKFTVPDDYEFKGSVNGVLDDGKRFIGVGGTCWFTNLEIQKHHEELILVKSYQPDLYPKYINYDAIHVKSTADIPRDYSGLMGVPITFMDKYNPEQFIIVGQSLELARPMSLFADSGTYMSGGNRFYTTAVTPKDIEKGFKYHREYDRLVIRNLHPEKPRD